MPVEDGVAYDIRLRAVSLEGLVSEWAEVLAHVVVGKTTPPSEYFFCFRCFPILDAIAPEGVRPRATPNLTRRGFHRRRAPPPSDARTAACEEASENLSRR